MRGRGAAFVAVGALGFVLQIGALALMTMAVGWPYAPATALAVEIAVLHNFFWHERWTWRDRTADRHGLARRLVRYHVGTGLTSVGGNLLVTALWVEAFHLDPMAANVGAVATMSLANFLVADRWVFRPQLKRGAAPDPGSVARGLRYAQAASRLSRGRSPLRRSAPSRTRRARLAIGLAALLMVSPPQAHAAELQQHTVAAWNGYVAAAEGRLFEKGRTAIPHGEQVDVPGGAIHHWRGSALVEGVTLDQLLDGLMFPGTPPAQEDVLEARVLARSHDSLRVYLKLVRRAIVTVTYDTEHEMTFRRHSRQMATGRSIATKIEQVDGGDHGFLWRLNSYWRYTQRADGVLVELESLSVSRSIPALLRPAAGPIIGRVARESMTRTLEAMRAYLQERYGARGQPLAPSA
jgi:putative flippase GtrA